MDDTATRIERLERQVRRLEDRQALYQLIATYGPAVDSGSAAVVADLWTEDGTYDATPAYPTVMEGRDAVHAMVDSPQHRSYLAQGCGHLLGLPHLEFDGDDRAVATCHAQLLLRDETGDSFRVWRLTANQWDCVRTPDGWRVARRVNRLLAPGGGGQELFAAAVAPAAGPAAPADPG